jgi:hypothetical protein
MNDNKLLKCSNFSGEKTMKDAAGKQKELEALRRFGMRWAVLLSLSYDLAERRVRLPPFISEKFRASRVILESGCFSTCDVCCWLDGIEQELVLKAASIGKEYMDGWLSLLAKAAKGQLTREEVMGLPFIRPVVTDCEFLRCACEPLKTPRSS